MPVLNNRDHAIGVFDSGLGGLTVAKEIIRALPNENIVYFGDTARVPYGTKSKEAIIKFSIENTNVLLRYKVKMIVVACNSSSSYALSILRERFKIPIVGVIEPGAKKAMESTRNNRVGVIATSATIKSQEYVNALKRHKISVSVIPQACPFFVPLVEEGWFNKKVTLLVARQYLAPMKRKGVDTLILGCTHYPLLKSVLKKVMGKDVILVDSAKEVASQVKIILESMEKLRLNSAKPKYQFLVSDRPQEFRKIAMKFLGWDISREVKNV